MDLLGQEYNNAPKPKSKGKKVVLNLLIVSIILLVVVIALIYLLKGSQPKKASLYVNNESKTVISGLIINDEASGKKYVSLKDVASLIGYEYQNGEYLQYEESKTKGYLENSNQIIGFELGKNKIYKTVPNTEVEFEYYEIKNPIIQNNDKLYIALEDFDTTCDAVITYSDEKDQTVICTTDYLADEYEKKVVEQGVYKSVNKDFENQKAIIYNMLIVAKSEEKDNDNNNKYGVITTSMQQVITPKYKEIKYNEYTGNFIVAASNGKYGVISKVGQEVIVEVKYDSVRIVNYDPLMYEVKLNNKYGIINKEGKVIANTEYDKLGYAGDKTKEQNAVLIIKNVYDNKDGIVVCKNNKYGILDIETGREITPVESEITKIYSKTDNTGKKEYYVELSNQEVLLSKYVEYVNTISVNIPKENQQTTNNMEQNQQSNESEEQTSTPEQQNDGQPNE